VPLAVIALCGCGSATAPKSAGPAAVKGLQAVKIDPAGTRPNPTRLGPYLHAWERSWWRWSGDLARVGEGVEPSYTPDSSWGRASRSYEKAAIAYRLEERRLAALLPPSTLRAANEAYLAGVRRQATRLQDVSDALTGTDPAATARALEALSSSQLLFDQNGARGERAVIAACKDAAVRVPKIIRREYISNGQRTA
jgi:hypothetical protein